MAVIRWDDLDLFRRGPGPFDGGTSGPPWPRAGRNLPDLQQLLDQHGDDGTGYCKAVCKYRMGQYPYRMCPTWVYADKELRKLLAERGY